jgi:hypothetical protein
LDKEIKKKEKSLRYKTKKGWKKVDAPLYDRQFQASIYVIRYILTKLYRFQIKEERTKIIPFEAFKNGIRNPDCQLPTINLIAVPPLTFPYNLQKSSLSCIYWGNEWFLIKGRSEEESEKEKLSQLISNLEELYPKIRECLRERDYESAQRIFSEYYQISEEKYPKKEPEAVKVEPSKIEKKEEKLEIKEKEELKPAVKVEKIEEKLEIKEVPKPMKVSRHKKAIPQPKISEEKEIEIPEYNEKMETEIAEYLKNKYDPKDFFHQVLPKTTYEAIVNIVWKKSVCQEATRIFWYYIQRGCKRDSVGEFLYQKLVKIKNDLGAELEKPRKFK